MSETMLANMEEIRAQIKASLNRSKELLYQDHLQCHLSKYSELENNLKRWQKHVFLDSAESLLEKITKWKRNKSVSLSDEHSLKRDHIIVKMDNFLDKYDYHPLTPKIIRSQSATYPYRLDPDEEKDSNGSKNVNNSEKILSENELINKDISVTQHQDDYSSHCKYLLPVNFSNTNRIPEFKPKSKSDVNLSVKLENINNAMGQSDTIRSHIAIGHEKFYVPTFEEFKRIHKQNSLPPKPEHVIGLKVEDSTKESDVPLQELSHNDPNFKDRLICKCVMGVSARSHKLVKSSSLNSGMDDSDRNHWRNLQRTHSLDMLSLDTSSKWDQYRNLMTSLETHIKSENPTRPKIIHRCVLEGKIKRGLQNNVEKIHNIINSQHLQTKKVDPEKNSALDNLHLHSKWRESLQCKSFDNLPHQFSEKSRMYAYQMNRAESSKSLNVVEPSLSTSRAKLGTLTHKYIPKNEKHPKLQRSSSERIRRGNDVEAENVIAFYKKMSDKIARLKEPFSYRSEFKDSKSISFSGSASLKSKSIGSTLNYVSKTQCYGKETSSKKMSYAYPDFTPIEKRTDLTASEMKSGRTYINFHHQTDQLGSTSYLQNKLFKQRHRDLMNSQFVTKRTPIEKPSLDKSLLPKIQIDNYYVNLDKVSPLDNHDISDKKEEIESQVVELSPLTKTKTFEDKLLMQSELCDKIESASSSGVSSVISSDSKQFTFDDANQEIEIDKTQIEYKNVLSSEDNGVAMEINSTYQENLEVVVCLDCDQNFERLQTETTFLCKNCQKNRIERKKTILEILETERRYGRDLKIIKQEFYRPMKTANLLSLEQLESVFGNLDDLISVNEKFIEKLLEALDFADKNRDEDFCTVSIGKVVLEVTPMFLVFEEYCVKQASASVLLSSLEKEKDILRIFLQVSQAENSALRRMNLSSFLIVPVQRITRYPLLLNRLHSVTPYSHVDRIAIKEAVAKVESHLEHINMHTNGNGGIKLKRKISNATKKNIQVEYIELRKIALDALGWQHSDTDQVLSGKLLYTQPTDHLWAKRGKVLKFCPVHALLLRTGKDITEEKPALKDNPLMFRGISGIEDAALVLIKEKNGRLMPLREPFHLDKCVVAIDPDFDEVFEIQELTTKDVYLVKAEDFKSTQEWVKQLKLHAWDRGAWRKRRPALANIMMSNISG